MPIQRFQKIVIWAILVGILVYMFVLVFQDAEQTGQKPDIAGALIAWAFVVAFTWLIVWFRGALFNLFTRIFEFINDRLGG